MKVLGIDEAGRGCVLGALVVAGFVVDAEDDELLRAAGADDSKKLSPKRRWLAREALADLGTADVRQISATAIDAGNLNALEEEVIADLVRTHAPDLVRIDALGPPSAIPRVIARLQAASGHACQWVMAPKADSTWPVVGAASIFAKTTRDAELERLKERFGTLGSGYPSDPKTRAWLTDWKNSAKPWPAFVRTRWGTIAKLGQQELF